MIILNILVVEYYILEMLFDHCTVLSVHVYTRMIIVLYLMYMCIPV